MKKKLFASFMAALFVGSCVSAEIAMAASTTRPSYGSMANSSQKKKNFQPVYSQGTKSDGARRGSVSGGKPTNAHNLTNYSKHCKDMKKTNGPTSQSNSGSRRN